MEPESTSELTIGEVAGAADVSVRTVRHYEAVGLLSSAGRSYGGHRRYLPEDLAQLRRIVALRRFGFGLESIRLLLEATSGDDALALTRLRLEQAAIELQVARRFHDRLQRLAELLGTAGRKTIDELIVELEDEEMGLKIDQISTGLGDAGETDLTDGTRVSKLHPVIAAVGVVEELGAQIGLALAVLELPEPRRSWLERVANDLFDVGYDLGSPPEDGDRRPRIGSDYVDWVASRCDEANAGLEPLDSFVAWFGSPTAAHLNVCRAVCRRAELQAIAVEATNPHVRRYLNRLSDLFFAMARAEAVDREEPWRPGQASAAGR